MAKMQEKQTTLLLACRAGLDREGGDIGTLNTARLSTIRSTVPNARERRTEASQNSRRARRCGLDVADAQALDPGLQKRTIPKNSVGRGRLVLFHKISPKRRIQTEHTPYPGKGDRLIESPPACDQ